MSSPLPQARQSVNSSHPPSRSEVINPSLMKLKLLEVLRNNDKSKLLDLVHQMDSNESNGNLLSLKNDLLLFAVQVAPLSMVKYVVENKLIDDINSHDLDGNTALHLAAISNRSEVIEYLMLLPNINDCVYNLEAKQPIQCTTNIETAQLMDYLRTKHIEKIASKLRNGFETRNFDLLDKLLSNPRDKELLDINGTDPVTSDTVLIEFVKKGDYEMVQFILDHGGDPFKRSLNGKLPEESTNDPEMKKIIEDSFAKQNIMESTTHHQDGAPSCKGFLMKWTNFAGGYKLRWFVLDHNAVLSYYKSPNDMNNTCRGLIHLAHAMLKVDSSENTKFEIIIQNPSDGSPVKWHLKANHSTEAQKWIWILQNAIRFAKDVENKQRKSIMLPHILNEDLPQHAHELDHHPATIPETNVLSTEAIAEEAEKRRPVSSIISDAHSASSALKELINATDSETDLPLKTHIDNIDEIFDNDNGNNNNYKKSGNDNDSTHDNIYNTTTNDNTNKESNFPDTNHDTNTSYDNFDSLRNQVGPVPDRSSQYSGSSRQHHAERAQTFDGYNRNRATSFSSVNSTGSERSSKHSLAKSLYKKPLKKLSHIGRKTRDSFSIDNAKEFKNENYSTPQLAEITSIASYNSTTSSGFTSPVLNNEKATFDKTANEPNTNSNENDANKNEQDEEEEDDDDDDDDEALKSKNPNQSTDINVVRNQMSMQLKTFRDFLISARTDESIAKDDLVEMSVSILKTLNMLINQEGECVNAKYSELVKRLEKQQKISSIWENSIKQLELEIHDREDKIVKLEDKLKAVKKSLRNSVSQLHASHLISKTNMTHQLPHEHDQTNNASSAAALARQALTANLNKRSSIQPIQPIEVVDVSKQEQEEHRAMQHQKDIQEKFQSSNKSVPELPSYAPPPVPFDPTLTEFLEESDESEDEFFDAEESDEIKDMSVLERRETMKALKRKQSEAAKNVSNDQSEAEIPKETAPPVPVSLPPPVPTTEVPQYPISNSINNGVNSYSQEVSSIQKSESTAVNNEPPLEITKTVSNKQLQEAKFKPVVDAHGRYIVDKHALISSSQNNRYKMILDEYSFEGYEDPLRLSLAPEDNRPKMSLWGVLKSLVGKDMTKMTLPVTFNEPTSLLQRNVEVIEYSELLDKAAAIENSTLRLVYVATFAASEYASTVGRIAKPFNPLLGETFEYSRPDKGYRCFVEQVSHHPPISALIAESASWSYYGESNVKTKFLGRSFDIKHMGTWFCEVFPDAGVECKNGKKSSREVYSWKKVNNSVIGIIVGNPTIDNYGGMEIHNHMTGDYMKFEFKPRGWRASSAYEVKGEVFNAKGKLMYYVGGHWNSKIFCKPADDKHAERFLVWEAAPRREMMFHLTDFAATLNAPQPHLLPKLACTDTRLRPDQRAMEDGNYDLAAEEKNRVEEKQREVRRQMEMKGETYHPVFFAKDKHAVTGEEYWKYKGTYWSDRRDGKLKNYKDIF